MPISLRSSVREYTWAIQCFHLFPLAATTAAPRQWNYAGSSTTNLLHAHITNQFMTVAIKLDQTWGMDTGLQCFRDSVAKAHHPPAKIGTWKAGQTANRRGATLFLRWCVEQPLSISANETENRCSTSTCRGSPCQSQNVTRKRALPIWHPASDLSLIHIWRCRRS